MQAHVSFRTRRLSVALVGLISLFVAACPARNRGVDWEAEKARRRAGHGGIAEEAIEDRTRYDGAVGVPDAPAVDRTDWGQLIAMQTRPSGPIVLDRGDLVLSAAIARAEAAVDPGTRLTHLRMTAAARELIAKDDTERALDLLERAISIDGREGFAYLYLGYVYARRGDGERSRNFLDQAQRLLPPDPSLAAEIAELRGLSLPIDARRGDSFGGANDA